MPATAMASIGAVSGFAVGAEACEVEAASEPMAATQRPAGARVEVNRCQEPFLYRQIDDVRLLVKGLDGELRAAESRQLVLNRRLAEVCGRLNIFQEEQSQLEGRLAAIETGQKTLAASTQQALRAAATAQRRLDEAEFEACLEGLSRTDASHSGPMQSSPQRHAEPELLRMIGTEDYFEDEQQPEPEGEAQPATPPRRHESQSHHLAHTNHSTAECECRKHYHDVERYCREQLSEQAQHLAELGQAVTEMLARARTTDAAEPKEVRVNAEVHTRLEQQSFLLEQVEARVWALAEGQTRLEQQVFAAGKESSNHAEMAALASSVAEITVLKARVEELSKELNKVQPLATKGAAPQAPCDTSLIKSTFNDALDFPAHISAAMQRLETRLDAAWAGVSRRCDNLQTVVDQHLQQACKWLPDVDDRVKRVAAQCQDNSSKIEAQEVLTTSLRAEHDASCRRLLVLADQVAGLTNGSR